MKKSDAIRNGKKAERFLHKHDTVKRDSLYKNKVAAFGDRVDSKFAHKPFADKFKKTFEEQIKVYESIENLNDTDKNRLQVYKQTITNLPRNFGEEETVFTTVRTLLGKDFDIKKNSLLE
jgi:hypothetical protein